MDNPQYLTFQKFSEQGLANELAEIFQQNNIEYVVENSLAYDVPFSNSEVNDEYRVKIRKQDFEKANALLLQISEKQLEVIDRTYFLFDFSDEELLEIVIKPDEWNQYDYLLAQKILKERGKEISPELVETIRKQRLKDLAKPDESQKTWIYAGYIFSFFGGILSIIIGWHLLSHKKTLPNGDRIYAYTESDRKHGNRIFLIGLGFFVFWFVVRIGNLLQLIVLRNFIEF